VSTGRQCASHVLGLDNRGGLPPFFPVLGNTAGIFGYMLQACDPEAYIGQLPFAVLHAPPEPRSWDDDEVWRAPLVWTMADVVFCAMTAARAISWRESGSDLLTIVGRSLMRLASSTLEDFERIVQRERLRRETARASRLRLCLERHDGQPRYWADDVKRALAITLDVMGQARPPVPFDVPGAGSEAERRLSVMQIVRSFGELMCTWNDILEETRALGALGIRIAEPI
jgi:hypothetical protein